MSNEKNSRDFKGVWIPKEIWLNTELKLLEKVILIEIESLDNEHGCYARNDHFVNFFNKSERRIQAVLKSLKEKGYIKVIFIYKGNNKKIIEKRIMKVNKMKFHGIENKDISNPKTGDENCVQTGDENCVQTGDENCVQTGDENCVVNNTSYNNNNIYSRVVDHLNKKTDSSFKSRTIKTQGLIKARIAEGFTEEEFIKVIDNKVSEWVGTEYEKYLRPETLFGTKFESYLNQKVSTKTSTKNQEVTHAAYKPFEFN